MRNEPNFGPPDERLKTGDWRLKTAFKKQTQFYPPYCLVPPLCETNPIYRPTTPLSTICYLLFLTKRTQFQPADRPKIRNEPNLPYRWRLAGFPTFSSLLSPFASLAGNSPRPPIAYCLLPGAYCLLFTKQTQFRPPLVPQLHETNPISAYQASRHPLCTRNKPNLHRGGYVEDQKNETNPIPPGEFTKRTQSQPGPQPKNAKRTQSQPGKNAKQTQFTTPTPKKCKTNPISSPSCLVPHASCLVPPLYETNPISTPTAPRLRETNPISTPAAPAFRKTNPIPAYQVSRHPLFQRNEPNPTKPTANRQQPIANSQQPKNAKQTQFPYAQTKANSLCINDLNKIGDGYLFPHHPPPRTIDNAPLRASATGEPCSQLHETDPFRVPLASRRLSYPPLCKTNPIPRRSGIR